MKKTLMITLVTLAGSSMAFAGTVRENMGQAGLGSTLLGDEEGIISHIGAATLNGISGNQTFAVSSGTLGADQSTSLVSNKRLRTFIGDNMDQLARDVATGKGQTLGALAVIMEVPQDQRDTFNNQLQAKFETLFPHENVTADEVVANLQGII